MTSMISKRPSGVALNDSPVSLLVYILEKFSSWTVKGNKALPDGGLSRHFTKAQLLDNVMVYWSTGSITTSMRLYAETINKRHFALKLEEIPTTVPTWCIQARHELRYHPTSLLKLKYPNLVNATILDGGGHFLAFEKPKEFSESVMSVISRSTYNIKESFYKFHILSQVGTIRHKYVTPLADFDILTICNLFYKTVTHYRAF